MYGRAALGGAGVCEVANGWGIVFELSPNSDGSYTETVLHNFNGNPVIGMADGVSPATTPIFDNLGNLYGATAYGGPCGCVSIGYGVVYELTPNGDGTWTDTNIFGFASPATQGGNPIGNIAFDKSGKLYGKKARGGRGGGAGAALQFG